jgi:3-(3-hydroxy-phenyl)propionate hydroxylase
MRSLISQMPLSYARAVPHPETTDVLVVGAGPTGLTLAALLAARGIRVIVIEQRATTSDEPKAISLDDEAMRIYQRAGIADRVLSILVPGLGTTYYDADGERLFDARAERPHRLGYPFKNPFAQPELERVLADAVRAFPTASLRFGHRLTGVEADPDGVTAIAGGSELRARYLVGADGGRSTVRSLRGIGMSGRTYDTPWLVIDALNDPHTERFGMHHAEPARPHVIVPGLDGRCRYEFLLHPGEGSPGETPRFRLMRDLLARYRPLEPRDIERAVVYTFHGLIADRWQDGRVLLAGDAAHMMPPFAGQGLNSGLRDAANLSWKLEAVVRGEAPASTLASYETERRPHAVATIRSSEKLGRIVMTTSERLARSRDRLVRAALSTEAGRDFLENMRYRPVARIETGMVVPGDGAGEAIAQPRVFDGSAHRMVLFDDVLGPGWALIGVDVTGPEWARVASVGRRMRATRAHVELGETFPRDTDGAIVLIDLDGRLIEAFAPHRGRFLLVRPDRFVAARWTATETPTVEAALAPWTTEKEVRI